MPIRAYAYSRRIIHDLVHSVVQKEVSTLTPQMDLSPRTRVYVQRGPLGQQSEWILTRGIGYCSMDSYRIIFGSFPADVVDILLGNLV